MHTYDATYGRMLCIFVSAEDPPALTCYAVNQFDKPLNSREGMVSRTLEKRNRDRDRECAQELETECERERERKRARDCHDSRENHASEKSVSFKRFQCSQCENVIEKLPFDTAFRFSYRYKVSAR